MRPDFLRRESFSASRFFALGGRFGGDRLTPSKACNVRREGAEGRDRTVSPAREAR
jgi:hypothetical protein